MSFSRILLRLIIILGCAVVGAYIGTVFEAYRILENPQAFRSEAKLSVSVQAINHELKEKETAQSHGTMAELLETAEMSRRALERVKALHPGREARDVTIRATQTKGSDFIINIHATGTEPKYTRIFLDALLDEFISFRHSTREEAQGPELQEVLNEAAALQKEMKESETALEKARAGAGSISATSDHERLLVRLTTQRNERDERSLIIKTMAENDAGRALLQTRLSAIELEIQDMEAQLQRQEAAASELKVLTEKFDSSKQAYDKKFEQAGELQTSIDTDTDSVAVMERATPASEIVEDWRLPVAVTACGGGLVGLVLSLFLVSSPSPKPPQRPRAF